MKAFSLRYPFTFAVLVCLTALLGQLVPLQLPMLSLEVQILIGRIVDCLLAVVLLSAVTGWREAGFVSIKSWRLLIPYAPLIFVTSLMVILITVVAGIKVRAPAFLLFGAVSFLAGAFVEEALFRGVVLRTFLPRGLLKASLLSASVFSLVHLANLLVGQDLIATLSQLVRSFLLGFAFVAPLAYTRNIWPLIILHAAMNFFSFLGSGNITVISTESPDISQVLAELVLFGSLSGYGFWLLRRAERRNNQRLEPADPRLTVS